MELYGTCDENHLNVEMAPYLEMPSVIVAFKPLKIVKQEYNLGRHKKLNLFCFDAYGKYNERAQFAWLPSSVGEGHVEDSFPRECK